MPRIWVGYAVVGLVSLAITLSVLGGFSTPGQAVPIVLSGIAGAIGLITSWQLRPG